MTALAILLLGFFLGMRHATDADHVVAVTAIVSREQSARGSLWVGALWGLGHSATILIVGGALVLFGWVIPPRIGMSMELSVAVMLIVLGAMNIRGTLSHIESVAHRHGPRVDDDGPLTTLRGPRSLRPLLVGVVHGLSGSAAIALLVLTTIDSASRALLYLAVFGLGTLLGMMLLTLAMSVPLSALARHVPNAERRLARVTGLVSIALGLFLAYRIGIVDGLFGAPTWRLR